MASDGAAWGITGTSGCRGNSRKLEAFRYHIVCLWLKTLRRRSQRHKMNWDRMNRIIVRWLPLPRICRTYPNLSLYVTTRGRRPSALAAHAGICAGGVGQPASLPRPFKDRPRGLFQAQLQADETGAETINALLKATEKTIGSALKSPRKSSPILCKTLRTRMPHTAAIRVRGIRFRSWKPSVKPRTRNEKEKNPEPHHPCGCATGL